MSRYLTAQRFKCLLPQWEFSWMLNLNFSEFCLGFSKSFHGACLSYLNALQKAGLCHPDWARSKYRATGSCITALLAAPLGVERSCLSVIQKLCSKPPQFQNLSSLKYSGKIANRELSCHTGHMKSELCNFTCFRRSRQEDETWASPLRATATAAE